ncbi:MAG: ribosomal protein S18-alanine N-acetyltransferase [Dictyoglomaceae bacterium]|nr:ribosomal protein S18-alanine N-acetyltransferase [Dictyoglomaceae bacterium]
MEEKNDIKIRSMTEKDIDEVYEINRLSFSSPWSRESFEKEILSNKIAYYFIAEKENRIVGYIGFWQIFREAQITTIAVHPDFRGKGIGEALLDYVIELCRKNSIEEIVLEVRISNTIAQNLYFKKGFKKVGIRKWYYRDGEDALVMIKKLY